MRSAKTQFGYSLVELIVSIGILAVFFTLGTVVISSWLLQDRLDISIQRIVSLVHEVQAQSWANYSLDGIQGAVHGVHFTDDGLILFSGQTFVEGASANQFFALPEGVEISQVGFVDQELLFTPLTGTVSAYSQSNSDVTVRDKRTADEKRIMFNEYGVAHVVWE